ncbi:unnamed protein product [Clonostachys rosea]|uniref:NmrA-like domain-containing protein n=1 Tax=Bionectria ochroleuca TaxID=29856 RepID=A0ABY6UXL6_BIOOC|nr:unnamed protein product [Clonostachys rosea]
MAVKKTIVVVGGTGRIGKSVVASLVRNNEYHVKVTTRDPTTARAKHVQNLGAELVKADSWSPDQLEEAFSGAWGVFLNTNSEAPEFTGDSPKSETEMGKNIIDAARAKDVKHFVFASLPEANKATNGVVQISTFFHKNNISEYGQQAGFKSFVNVNVGWMMENFWNPIYEKPFGGFARLKDSDGYLTIFLFPMGNTPESTPFTSVRDDYGDIVHGVFNDPESWDKQTVWAVSHPVSFQGVADAYNRIVGQSAARYVPRTEPTKADTPEKTAEVNAIRRYVEYVKGDYCDGKPVDQTAAKTLKRSGAAARGAPEEEQKLQTIDGFIQKHAFNGEDM